MMRHKTSRLATFLVVFLLVMLPISTSAQLSAATTTAAAEEQPQQLPDETEASYFLQSESEVEPQVWCLWPAKDCAGKCSLCWIGSKWYCGSSGAVCCDSSAKFCDSSAGKCWTDNCPAGTKWTCKSTGAVCESICTDPSYPTYCNGQCFGCKNDQYKTYKVVCDNPPWCQVVSCIHSSYPNKCNNDCWSNCGSGEDFVCPSSGNPYCVQKCTDKDGDGYGSGCSKGSDCNDNDASIWKKNSCNACAKEPSGIGNSCTVGTGDCQRTGKYKCDNAGTGTVCDVSPGSPSAEVCDGVDNDCDGLVDECCSDPNNPYSCEKTSTCWTKAKCDETIYCKDDTKGHNWYACLDSGRYDPKCVDNHIGCCEPQYPYYCPSNEFCFSSDSFCDGRTVYNCNSKYQICNKKTDAGACFSNELKCCPSGETWWESDKQCHRSSEPQKCSVPDGTSAQCDCDSDSDCKSSSSKPYCGEGGSLYDVRTPQGYHACLASKPKYCGDGSCEGSETYSNCQTDCASLAPKGTITTEVVYHSGSQKDKPIQGAYVYLDSVLKGNTDEDGKLSFQASYGSRTLKVECPDSTFCNSATLSLAASSEYKRIRCTCNPPGDSDNDGYSDDDERLLGTDPKNANSNFGTTFTSDSVDLLACIPTPASFFILWKEYKKSGSIIESHSLVVNSLNVTSVMSASFEDEPYAVAQALVAAGFEAEGAEIVVNPVNVTLENVMRKAEYVDGVRMQDGILLIATDKDGQTTALITIGAGCVGAFSGSVYGIGQGLFDDIKGVIDGIWFVITHLDDVKKIWSGVKDLVSGVVELLKSPGETVWTLFRNILDKGQGINLFREGRLNKPEPYRHFQVGFVYGFATGYVVEQVALGAVIFSKVAKAFKLGQLFGKTGKAVKLLEKLDVIKKAEDFGAEIAEKLSKLKYLKEGIDNWLDAEIKGLARIMKHNEDWLKGLSEAEAKVAAKHADELTAAGKVTDAAFGDLAKTKLGQQTLKASDATTNLLEKQSKLVQKWGAKKADDVVTKCSLLIFCDTGRVNDLNKILKAMPENLVDNFNPERAVKLLGDKKLIEAAENVAKGVDSTVISNAVGDIGGYEKLLDYTKAVKKLDSSIVNPLGDIGKHQLLKIVKNPSLSTRVGDQTIDGIGVLKKGDALEIWGWEHIKAENHHNDIQKALSLADNDEAVKRVITEVLETPDAIKHIPGDKFEFTKVVTRDQKSNKILVVVSDRIKDQKINKGSIQTAHPD